MTYRKYYETCKISQSAERRRLCEEHLVQTWRKWGPYLSERQWGTVREWYDSSKNPWTDFVHDQARSRAYRWGEDGIAGISDLGQLLCFSVALWNENDPIIKERLFGLTNGEGNHGEDSKEYYYYLDNTPTHSYMKYLYKYPYRYPYADLTDQSWSRDPLEFELIDTGALDDQRYFDVTIEYAKNTPEDLLIQITVVNRGKETRTLHVLPTLLYRNTWSWSSPSSARPVISVSAESDDCVALEASPVVLVDPLSNEQRTVLERRWLYCAARPEVLFTENETNLERFHWGTNSSLYVKDGINDYVVSGGTRPTVNPARRGSKAAVHYVLALAPGESKTIALRLTPDALEKPFAAEFAQLLTTRRREADEFYDAVCPYSRSGSSGDQDRYNVQRQAFAGMLWSKQLYYLVAHRWLSGDTLPPSSEHQNDGILLPWAHLYCKDVLSMPDKWEYPWFAAWDLAFHTTTLAIIDPEFAKHQLELMVMEWYQHPNGQIPAYEWDFSNINPPVHAWAAWRVFQTEREIYGQEDRLFLERVFNKLNMNFTWWVNKVDRQGNNIFGGGFLGMDNIRIVDRDPSGNPIEQADGTAWMAMFCLNMLRIALELEALHTGADASQAYQYKDCARKYLQHFMYLCSAMNHVGREGLWDDQLGFFMDSANNYGRLRVFSMVGLVPLFAVEHIARPVTDPDSFYDLYGFLRWFARNRRDLVQDNAHINLDQLIEQVSRAEPPQVLDGTAAVVDVTKLRRILERMLAPEEFLSSRGIRSLSKIHLDQHAVPLEGANDLWVTYEPAESIKMKRMGGNSNWCGPIWLPVNYLIIESLRKHYSAAGPDFKVEHPKGSGQYHTLDEVADDLSSRLLSIFLRDGSGERPLYAKNRVFQTDPCFRDYILFYEYFHGGDRYDACAGSGLGASHQTGWTGLVANLIQELGVRERARQAGIGEDPDMPGGWQR
jgi:hypothetical protein